MWWWVLVSVLTVAVGWTHPIKRESGGVFGVMLFLVFWGFLTHLEQAEYAYAWLVQAMAILSAAAVIAERGSWTWVRDGIIWGSLAQIPFMAWGWMSNDVHLVGTLAKRSTLSMVLCVASIWSYGPMAALFAVLSTLTGGWVGAVPSMLRIMRFWIAKLEALGLLIMTALLAVSSPVWWPKLSVRLDAWHSAIRLKPFFIQGYGFLPFPVGFQEVRQPIHGVLQYGARDFHSTFIDTSVRFGLVGVLFLIGFLYWSWQKCKDTWEGRWLFGTAVWIGIWQSAESMPAVVMCWLAWTIWMAQKGEKC